MTRSVWQQTTWGNMATLEYGRALRGYGKARADYPVFGTNGPIGWHDRPLFPGEGVVVGRKGAYRGIHYSHLPCWVIDTAFYLKMRHTHEVQPLFAYYQLKTIDLDAIDSGSAIPSTSREAFYQIPVSLPPLTTQLKIASILSAYDDLVENNTRRVQILEAMAQAIYREWFVEFRFPGHEGVGMVDSALGPIPDGWKVRSLRGVTLLISRGVSPRYDDEGDARVINQKCIRGGWLSMEQSRLHSSSVPPQKLLETGDVLINSTGTGTLGRVAQVLSSLQNTTADSHVTIVRPELTEISSDYIGLTLLSREAEFASMATGSTGQTELSRGRIGDVRIVVPDMDTQQRFFTLVSPMRSLTVTLRAEIVNLRQTRDLLLPRLISGEIDVSGLDLGNV